MSGQQQQNETARSGMERHFNTVLLSLIVLLVAWMGNTIVTVDKRTAVMEEALSSLRQQSTGFYPAATASRDFADIARRLERLEDRMDGLEKHSRESEMPGNRR